MPRRTLASFLVLVLLGSLVAVGAPSKNSKPPKEDYYELYKILVDTMDQVERNYIKEVDRRELFEAAIKGVLSKLDPYSAYISPKELRQFRTSVESEFGGIGIQISMDRGKLKIISPLAGTPAYRAGLLAGDRIVEIGGKSTEGISLDEAVRQLKGETGTKVVLTVIHPGKSEKVKVEITREKIHVKTVLGDRRKKDDNWDFMLNPEKHIGYVRITAFSRDTVSEFREAMEELRAARLSGLILDLRFNPGGLLSSAIKISDLFISKGRIVSTKGRNSPERAWEARKEGTYEDFPMVVLVNRYSASASEIVSACLQDHKRAVIIGERTWGKGSIQNVIELESGLSALKLTTAGYRRPSGKNIHRFDDAEDKDQWGVMPEKGFHLRLGDAEMLGLLDDRRRRDVVRPHQSESDQPDKKPPEEKPDGSATEPEKPKDNGRAAKEPEKPAFVDRQLQMAVEYLTSELAKAR